MRDPRALGAFRIESRAHLDRLQRLVQALDAGKCPGDLHNEVMRGLHSLKGSSRMLGLELVEQLAHAGESLLLKVPETEDPAAEAGWVAELAEALEDAVEGTSGPAERYLERLLARLGQSLSTPAPFSEISAVRAAATVGVDELETLVRVSADIHSRAARVLDLAGQLQILEGELNRGPREQLRGVRQTLQRLGRQLTESALELREGSRELVMVPARDVLGPLGSSVRELALRQGKAVQYRSSGLETRVEVHLLQALKEPLLHLLRNSVHHGLETPEEREKAGKPPMGQVWIKLRSQSEHLVIEVGDDGRGLQVESLRDAAGQPQGPIDNWIWDAQASTAEEVDVVAGRGLGLAAVRASVAHVGGRITVQETSEHGTVIRLTLPQGALGISVLLVRGGDGQLFGLPTRALGQLRVVHPGELQSGPTSSLLVEDGRGVPIVSLNERLGLPFKPSSEKLRLVELLGEPLYLLVDEWLRHQSVMLQPLAFPYWPSGMLEGAFLTEEGEVCLVLNPEFLRREGEPGVPLAASAPAPRKILVVDDSVTARTLEASQLRAWGYQVREAENGEEALDVLRREEVDLVLTDVQMPRMDGLELLRRIRKDSDLPVVLLTSLSAEHEQRQGLEAGADAYLIKQRFDSNQLLETLERLL